MLKVATVSQIAVQGRFNGDEQADRLRLNISIDGINWVQHPDVFKVTSNDISLTVTPALTGKFIRLIPRTEQGMPICIRTELYGCYRTDKLAHYSLSKLPMRTTPEVGLDSSNTGIGRLSDGKLDDYLKFKSSTGEIEIELIWQEALNISELVFHISTRSNSCFSRVILESESAKWTYNLGCDRRASQIGPKIIPLLLTKVVDRLTAKLEFTGILELAEITWSKQITELKPVRMQTIVTEELVPVHSDLPPWLTLAGCVVGGILFLIILVIFVIVTRRRFRNKKRSNLRIYT